VTAPNLLDVVECLAQFLAPRGVGFFAARKSDDPKIRWHLVFLAQVVERGD